MTMVVVAPDVGRSLAKAVCEKQRFLISSFVGEYRRLKLERMMTPMDRIIEYGNKAFFVGDVARDEADDGTQMMVATKAHDDTKLLALTAIHQLVNDGDEVFALTCVPITNHVEKEKTRIKDLLAGEHTITVNGVKKRFDIRRVEVSAEGAVYAWYLKRQGLYHVLDAGSRTVNYVTAMNGGWNDKLSGTLDFGFETVRNSNVKKFGRMIAGKLGGKLGSTEAPILTIGGLAEPLATELNVLFPKVEVAPETLFANAVACEALGVTILEREGK